MKVTTTERGWAGHFIGADHCRFGRNTLIQKGKIRVIVSTVGNYLTNSGLPEEIGYKRYYETMAFRAKKVGAYWDADVTREYPFESDWEICADSPNELSAGVDNEANDMHEAVVAEIVSKLSKNKGETK